MGHPSDPMRRHHRDRQTAHAARHSTTIELATALLQAPRRSINMNISRLTLRWRWLVQLWPITAISLGIVLSFAWVSLLAWLFVCTVSGLL